MKQHIHILQHSIGVDRFGRGQQYRNHFVTGSGSVDFSACMALSDAGLMADHGPSALCGGMHCFVVTDAGRKFVAENSDIPPKLTRSQKRYQEWARVADAIDMSFGEWLKRGVQ